MVILSNTNNIFLDASNSFQFAHLNLNNYDYDNRNNIIVMVLIKHLCYTCILLCSKKSFIHFYIYYFYLTILNYFTT